MDRKKPKAKENNRSRSAEKMRPEKELLQENESLRQQLEEARDTIEAIRNGEIDALVVNGKNGHELFTLRSADHTYRVFIEKMSEGAVTLSPDGLIVYSNSSFVSIIDGDLMQVVSEPFERFVVAEDRDQFKELIRQGWKDDVKGEISLITKGGTVPVQLSITTLKMDEGVSLSVIVTNLTAQKEILKELKRKNDELEAVNIALEVSNHDLQQFASVASHDLQEPLRKIQIFSHLLDEKFGSELSEAPRNYVAKIVSSASRMKALIIDILNYSRLSAKDDHYESTDLGEMVNELLEDLELTIREKKATVTVEKLPVVEANRGQMRQVFQNLISNSLKFSKKDTEPRITIYSSGTCSEFQIPKSGSTPYCHLHIKDNGIGFEDKYARSIFNLFEKLHSKDDYEGTGIGLAITKKIIEKHNGTINVLSKPDAGSEFIISLPVHQHTVR